MVWFGMSCTALLRWLFKISHNSVGHLIDELTSSLPLPARTLFPPLLKLTNAKFDTGPVHHGIRQPNVSSIPLRWN